MNKKELFKKMWIPVTKRLPPNDNSLILVWNYYVGHPEVRISHTARTDMENVRRKKTHYKTPNKAVLLSDWMPIYSPASSHNSITPKEYGVMYTIGRKLDDGSYGMWHGPTCYLDELLDFPGEEEDDYILNVMRDSEPIPVYQWNEEKEEWISLLFPSDPKEIDDEPF